MPRFLISLIVLLLMGISPLSSASAAVNPNPYSTSTTTFSPKVVSLLSLAQVRVQTGKVVEAAYLLNLAHNVEPNNPFVLARLAVVLNMLGDYDGALDRLRRAQKMGATNDVVLAPMLDAMLSMGQNQNVLDLFPDPGPGKREYAAGIILRARASAMQVLGDTAGATEMVKRSLAILKDYDGLMTAARIALMQGNLDDTDARVEEALQQKPGDMAAVLLKIDLAMQRQKSELVQKMAEQLVADNPSSVAARITRIKVYLAANRADKAEADVDRILVDKPDMPILIYYKAIILARRGEAKTAWSIAHNLPKEFVQIDPGITLNIANMAIAAGYVESGATLLNVAVGRFPYLLEARLALADIRLGQKSVQYAINVLTPVQDSNDPRVAMLYARIALMKGSPAQARKYIEPVLQSGGGELLRDLDKDFALKSIGDYSARHPGDKRVKKQTAVLLMGFGELPKARIAYEALVRDDPADGLARNNLAWLIVQDDPARALALAQAAVKADPQSPDYLDTLGTMQMNRSDLKGAVGSLQKARDLRPDDPGISYHLALALEASGQGAQSKAILQELVKRGDFRDRDAAKELLARKLKMAGSLQSTR
jgi:tetratricopeptide (TPR) repeat protein